MTNPKFRLNESEVPDGALSALLSCAARIGEEFSFSRFIPEKTLERTLETTGGRAPLPMPTQNTGGGRSLSGPAKRKLGAEGGAQIPAGGKKLHGHWKIPEGEAQIPAGGEKPGGRRKIPQGGGGTIPAGGGEIPAWGLLVLSDSPAFPSLAEALPALRGRVVSTAGELDISIYI